MDRRNFLTGILAAAVAPAFIKTAGLLMPIKPIVEVVEFPVGASLMNNFAVGKEGMVWTATYEIVARPLDGFVHISST